MMRANLQKHRVAQWALTALAGAVLTACGGSDSPTNDQRPLGDAVFLQIRSHHVVSSFFY